MSEVVKAKTEEEKDAEQAALELAQIGTLRKSRAFLDYFQAEPATRAKQIERTLSELVQRRKPIDENERQFMLGQLDVLRRWRDKLDQDETANRATLGGES